jgi:serine protease
MGRVMGRLRRAFLAVLAGVAVASVAWVAPAVAAPNGVPGPPDQSSGGEPPVSGVVRPLTNGASNSSRSPGGAQHPNNLKYGGGGIQVAPNVYLVFWGSQWSASDPVAMYLQRFLGGLYGAQDNWSTSTTQYCQGVLRGSTTCGASATSITHPASSPLAGVWFDTLNGAAPAGASQSQLAAEARRAAANFSSTPLGANVQFVVVTPSGASPQGFGTSYCAWHSYTTSAAVGTIAYTNLPYIPDAGTACGADFVNSGAGGALDGVSIVEGHEYAESVTDPFLNAWTDQQGAENGDKCAWINSGQGAATNLSLGGSLYAVQSLWSNAFNSGAGGCVTSYP